MNTSRRLIENALQDYRVFGDNDESYEHSTQSLSNIITCYVIRNDITNPTFKDMFQVDIDPIIDTPQGTYTIRSAIYHIGQHADHGHYVTYIFDENECWCINDTEVQKGSVILQGGRWTNTSRLETVTMMFYERVQDNTQQSTIDNNNDHDNDSGSNDTIDMNDLIELHNEINDAVSNIDNIDEFVAYIEGLRNHHLWGFCPNMQWKKEYIECNILAIGCVRGMIPSKEQFGSCGYPGCNKIMRNGNERSSHWNKSHDKDLYYQYSWLTEFFNICNVDILTFKENGEKRKYMQSPAIKCPLCSFIAQKKKNIENHIDNAHSVERNQIKDVSWFYRYLWLLNKSKHFLTLDNIIYQGQAVSCKHCGYCADCRKTARNHPSVAHRDIKDRKTEFFEEANISYNLTSRDGSSISPFVGWNGTDNDMILREQNINEDILTISFAI